VASLIASKSIITQVANLQVPWSVNGFAHDFFAATIKVRDYFKEMWETTPVCRAEMIRMLKEPGVKPKDGLPM
jgi:histidinol-phosphate/aromatic aminotransferase/cobyric acid decarboxylase-like protein